MQQLGAQDGTLAKAGAQGIGGTVQLFLFIGFGWIGEKIQLLKIVGAGLFGAHPNKAHWAVGPHLAHQLPRGMVNHIGRVGGAVQRYLVAAAAEGVIHQLHRDDPCGLAVHPQPPGNGFTQRQHGGIGLHGALQVLRSGYAVAVTVVLHLAAGHRLAFNAVGVIPEHLPPHAEHPAQDVRVRVGKIPDGINANLVHPLDGLWPHAKQIAHRQRPQFLWHHILR